MWMYGSIFPGAATDEGLTNTCPALHVLTPRRAVTRRGGGDIRLVMIEATFMRGKGDS